MTKLVKKLFKIGVLVFPLVLAVNFLLAPVLVNAQQASAKEQKNCDTFARYLGPLAEGMPKFCSLSALLTFILEKLLIFSGAVSVLFIVFGGFVYLSSAGNEEQSEKGKKILINSIIGLVVIIMATAIVRVVSGALYGSSGGTGSGAISKTYL